MIFFRKNKNQKELSEEQKEKIANFGRNLSLKLRLPQMVRKANAYYAKHPKTVSFSILGSYLFFFLLSLIPSGESNQQTFEKEDTDYMASSFFGAMQKHDDNINKIMEYGRKRASAKQLVDSLMHDAPKDSTLHLNANN